jgi:hypothetical protein
MTQIDVSFRDTSRPTYWLLWDMVSLLWRYGETNLFRQSLSRDYAMSRPQIPQRRAQGLSRLAASSWPPEGLGLDWPEHGGILDRIGPPGHRHIVGKFKPVALGSTRSAAKNAPSGSPRRCDDP